MAGLFSLNVITNYGKSLIAQATSANPIVIVDALSSTNAASSLIDLASKDILFYNGISGVIQGSSATNNVAKIVTLFGNAGANSQIVKSIAIRGKLASQSDGEAVIMAAMSDPASEIYFPSNTKPTQATRFILNFAVNADGTIETIYADGASMSDLDRFVSMHKAGDPTQGDDQAILGNKVFNGDVTFNGGFVVGDLVCDSIKIIYSGTNGVKITSTLGDAFIDGDFLPKVNASLDLGASFYMWRHAYVQDVQFDGHAGVDPDHVQIYEDDGDIWLQPASSAKVGIGRPGNLCGLSVKNINANNISCQDITGVDLNVRDIDCRDIDASEIAGLLTTLYATTPKIGSLAEIELVNASGSDTTQITMSRGTQVTNLMTYESKTINVMLDGATNSGTWAILNKTTFSNTSAKVLAVMVEE